MKKIRLAGLVLLSCSVLMPLKAAQIDALTPMVQLDGSPFTGQDGKPIHLTLRSVVTNSLLGVYSDEPNLSGEDKLQRWLLAQRFQNEARPDLTAEEIALIKKLVAKNYPTGVAGQAWIALDAASARAKEKPQR